MYRRRVSRVLDLKDKTCGRGPSCWAMRYTAAALCSAAAHWQRQTWNVKATRPLFQFDCFLVPQLLLPVSNPSLVGYSFPQTPVYLSIYLAQTHQSSKSSCVQCCVPRRGHVVSLLLLLLLLLCLRWSGLAG